MESAWNIIWRTLGQAENLGQRKITGSRALLKHTTLIGRGEGGERGCCAAIKLTDTTRCDICGNHDRALASLELVQDPITLVLLLVTVNAERWPSVLAKEAGDLVSNALCACEDQDLVLLVFHDLLEVLSHFVALLEVGHDLDDLCDTVVSRELRGANVDLDVVVQEICGKLADVLGPSSGPHASLSVGANLANDLANLGLETHVQHAVSLVENEISNATQVSLAGFEHVNETTRGCNADLDAARKITDLLTLGDTTWI